MKRETDELQRLDQKPEVLAPAGDFETQASTFVEGPYYAAAEEVDPSLVEGIDPSVAGDKADPAGKPFPVDRRDFVKLFSMSTLAGAAACVRRPAETAIPYVDQPVDQVPGVATHYASTCASCPCACGIVVKTREGRPVKLEGSPDHPVSQGALCSMGQADIQSLYHPERLKAPQVRYGQRYDDASWDDVFRLVGQDVADTKKIGIIAPGGSGHRHEFYREFLKKVGSSENHLYSWESNALYADIAKAHELAFGSHSLPRFELEESKTIVGIGSDFLEIGTSPVYHTKSYSKAHAFDGESRGTLIQFESHLSLTGAKADKRHVIRPGSEWLTSMLLVRSLLDQPGSKGSTRERAQIGEILRLHNDTLTNGYDEIGISRQIFDETAAALLAQPSVVMAGGSANFDGNGTLLQLTAVFANILVGAYDKVLMFHKGWVPAPVSDHSIEQFIKDAPELDVVFVIGSNPVFGTPATLGVEEALAKVGKVVSMQSFPNEVDQTASFVLPTHHYLESWGDEQPVAGFWTTIQPVIRPTTGSKQAEDILLWIAASAEKSLPYKDYRTYLTGKWKNLHRTLGSGYDFDTFHQLVLKKGFIGRLAVRSKASLKDVKRHVKTLPTLPKGMVLISPLDHRLHDGRGAHLPVLQEIGDGLTTITWDSWIGLHPDTMKKLGLKKNQVARIEGPAGWFETAVYPMPGLHANAVVTPRGNGHRDKRSTISNGVGVNPLIVMAKKLDPISGQAQTSSVEISLTATDNWYRLAAMQKHNDIANRKDIVKKVTVADAKANKEPADLDTVPDLFPALEVAEHKWGMSIDLDKCTGCGACMVACSLENNVPQVGREQVLLGREMHWIRLDRYFYGDMHNPTVTFQPVMCQHCNHAPCEAVCPVFATTHDPEGLNAMTYNRCVGTRYCANGCPYKVRRFNWWTHKWNQMGERPMDRNPRALNPDVTVRTRGVMEKCSMCVGRLRDARHQAKKEERPLRDGEALTACQQTCAADAIEFGNLNDEKSKIYQARRDPRAYLMLGGDPKHGHYGIKTLPSVNYLAQVVHEMPESEGGGHH